MRKLPLVGSIIALALLLAPQVSSSQTAAFNFTPIPAGDVQQGWPGNLASLFTVTTDNSITISDLGIFNQSGTGFITGTVNVALFNVTTGKQVGQTVTFGPSTPYTAQGYAVYQQLILPVTLGPGNYAVDAVGFSAADTNANTGFPPEPGPVFNTFGGVLSFPTPGSFYDGNTSLDLANISDPHIYEAGTFEVSHVPEGGASLLYLLLAGAACFGGMTFGSRNGLANRA